MIIVESFKKIPYIERQESSQESIIFIGWKFYQYISSYSTNNKECVNEDDQNLENSDLGTEMRKTLSSITSLGYLGVVNILAEVLIIPAKAVVANRTIDNFISDEAWIV